jgi:tetratricopeptide (TPR) repeat protein
MTVTDKEHVSSPDIEAYQAMKLLESGKRQNAIEKCLNAIEHFGPNRNCFLVKARAHIEQEEFGFAEEALQSVLRLDPEHPAAWAMMGEVYFRLGRETKVEYCRQRLESIFPTLTDTSESDISDSLNDDEIDNAGAPGQEPDESSTSIVPLEDLDKKDGKQSVDDRGLDQNSDNQDIGLNQAEIDSGVHGQTGGLKSELFETATFADICVDQGKFEKALKIYKRLLKIEPDNAKYKEKIEMISKRWENNDGE